MASVKNLGGRPTTYNNDAASTICERIAAGKSLVNVCEELEIGYSTVTQWLKAHPEFAENYTQAREAQADFHADEIVDIADNSTIPADERRVRIDARKWKAGKMKPKVYGDKTSHEVAGPNGGPIPASLEVIFVKPGEDKGRVS